MAKTFRQIDEGFKWVFEGKTTGEQITRLKEWGRTCQCLVPIVRIGVGAEKPNWGLPEGMPPTVKLQEDIPEGMGQSTLAIEWRRVKQFITPGSNMNNLPDWKREQQWINLLEGIHHTEAKLLSAVKDGKLLELYPQLEALLKDLGIPDYNNMSNPKAKPKSKSKKTNKEIEHT